MYVLVNLLFGDSRFVRCSVFSERELTFTFAMLYRPFVCLSSTFVRRTQAIEIFSSVFTPFGTMAICYLSIKILRRSSQGNPSVGSQNSDFGPFQARL